ncbi:GGDEF domain-containing phosphodiesterase [Lacrimispora saccharolytica]|uniref:Diguanylate cyclase/phosphodiesterase n=1 Tax=Lacrimispora saccharolytica (strain ATCC 35040 / DSM 2544 / NRCC 2533 / WM1) TaxID=610130 RepID=D9R6L7_LACSW|nr:GGDEF domain-containing phosphodiesterase [Lacrimispora saccharolytica]ADL05427.1 diguanylate cyclase/phosphodiesterase [[Clostridium] saccharolyticum WM1]QRV20410.1 EAL domain-containing protein [Lacrimispora saccharolytica]
MSWFQKKTAPALQTERNVQAVEKTATESIPDRDACLKHLSRALDSGERGAVLKLHIENFKRLNQVFGYEYCENLLEQILTYLKEMTGKNVYHYIGVEYILILDKYSQGQTLELAEEIAGRFDRVWKVSGTDCLCSAQMGICSYPGHAGSPDQMLKCLDLAVIKAEEGGPNQAVVFDSALQKQLQRRQTIALYLRTALEKEEVEVRYRPTLSTDTGIFTRAELYMRIFIKGLGLVGASEFLPVAEDSGQIRAIEYYALEKTAQCIAGLTEAGNTFESIALPISPILFLQEDFLDEVGRIIHAYHIPKGKLALEIQESALTMAYLNINVTLQQLQEMGVEIILNEFGSGHSGISSILELPMDTLKLERLFVWQLETNPRSRYVIEGLVRMARDLNITIIAEGVETENQVKILTEAGCNYQQGFYYSPTLEKDILLKILGTSLSESSQLLTEEKEKMSRF